MGEHLTNNHAGHRKRLKRQFLESGLSSFSKHTILELLLFFSIPRVDTNEIAHALINHFGSFSGVLDAPYEELLKVEGVGEATALLLKLIPDISRVYLEEKSAPGVILDSSKKCGRYFLPKFVGFTEEAVYLVCLDSKYKVLNCTMLAEGSVNSVSISARKIAEVAVRVGATAVVLAHNHPKGLAIPSREDLVLTKAIDAGLEGIGIRMLDHIIVANDDFVSLADSGVFAHHKWGYSG